MLEGRPGHRPHPYTAGVIARDVARHYLLTRGQLPCPYTELVRGAEGYPAATRERLDAVAACTDALVTALHTAGGAVDAVAVVLGGASGAPQGAKEWLIISGFGFDAPEAAGNECVRDGSAVIFFFFFQFFFFQVFFVFINFFF
jgi:hypothetical protein